LAWGPDFSVTLRNHYMNGSLDFRCPEKHDK
jgi:hypothetical protein